MKNNPPASLWLHVTSLIRSAWADLSERYILFLLLGIETVPETVWMQHGGVGNFIYNRADHLRFFWIKINQIW